MIGQGGPNTSRGRRRSLAPLAPWGGLRLALTLALALGWLASSSMAGEETLRLRIAWGGGAERLWQGRIALSEGTLAEPVPLGIEADEAASMWLERGTVEVAAFRTDRPHKRTPVQSADGHLVIDERSPRAYDAVDLLVTAPLQASLFVELFPAEEKQAPGWIAICLADLVHGSQSIDLDDRGNRLVVRRSPGDELRVKPDRRSLVFAPGEVFKCELQPCQLPFDPGSKVRVEVQLLPARTSQRVWAQEYTITASDSSAVPLEVPLGRDEGAYDIVISAGPAGRLRWAQQVRPQLGLRQPTVERAVQVLVLNPKATVSAPEGRLEVVEEIDPAKPQSASRFAKLAHLPRLQRAAKGPLGNLNSHPVQHALGQLLQLAPNGRSGEVSWEAYLLAVNRPGEPHVLEVDYPSDMPQTFGISVIEPNAAGAVVPISLDSGVDQAEEIGALRARPEWRRHRLIFWPRTKTPLVLITNQREQQPAVYGKIRVLAGWQHLPRAFPASGRAPERLLAAYLDRPLFPENFCASETSSPQSDVSVDDWITFHEGGTRLVEYLHHVGFSALVLSVFADGSTLYPSTVLQPTPRYDTGAFSATGQDPVRKDGLEMLLRLFDREGLQLIPAVEFASPLAQLEAVVRRGGPAAEGLQWIGPEGTPLLQSQTPQRGRAPYYNLFHPRVQETMLEVIRELVANCSQHPSFTGLALQLSAEGYAQLPGPEWGLDDVTIAMFERDLKVRLPEEGPDRFARRAVALSFTTPDGRREWRKEWLEWRAGQLTRFYRRIQAELHRARPGAKLYLTGTDLLTGGDLARELRPSLPRRTSIPEALLRLGIDARQYGESEGIVLLRPERVMPHASLAGRAVDLELAQMPDWDRYFQGLTPTGSLFFHASQETRIPSFDEKSPFKPCYAFLATEPVPSARQNRQRFIRSLATLDPQVLLDGGWLLSMGQEDSLRDLIAVYRQLPAMRMERIADPSGTATQPVTIRAASRSDRTYVYLVNDAPFPTTIQVRVDAPVDCRLEALAGSRPCGSLLRDSEGASWEVELGPYGLVAATLSAPGVRFSGPKVTWPEEVRLALDRRIGELANRVAALRSPPLLDVLENPGFDRPQGQGGIPGWTKLSPSGVDLRLDASTRHDGIQSLRLSSQGPIGGVISQPFVAPSTGRLSMSLWLRVANPERQPPLRVAIEARPGDRSILRYAWFGQAPDRPTDPIPGEWSPFVVHVNDLPLETRAPLRIRIELMGPGEVWVDDLQLSDLAFRTDEHKDEHKELLRLIAPAEFKLKNGQVADCIHLLEGYWPQFLMDHVHPAEIPVARKEPAASRTQPEPSREPERSPGMWERVKNLVPERLRF